MSKIVFYGFRQWEHLGLSYKSAANVIIVIWELFHLQLAPCPKYMHLVYISKKHRSIFLSMFFASFFENEYCKCCKLLLFYFQLGPSSEKYAFCICSEQAPLYLCHVFSFPCICKPKLSVFLNMRVANVINLRLIPYPSWRHLQSIWIWYIFRTSTILCFSYFFFSAHLQAWTYSIFENENCTCCNLETYPMSRLAPSPKYINFVYFSNKHHSIFFPQLGLPKGVLMDYK